MTKTLSKYALVTLGLTFLLMSNAQLLPPSSSKSSPSPTPSSLGQPSSASNAILEGVDYQTLQMPQTPESKGKIEVIEFFWYACPHCYDFNPELEAWVKRQGKDVVFKRVPIAFREDFLPHSQIFYALEAMGKGDAFNTKVMDAIHKDRKQLLKEDEIFAWVDSQQGLDSKGFKAAYKSFSVTTMAKAANQMGSAYRISGVPTVAIQGKYITSPSIANGKERTIKTMEFLVAKARLEPK